MFYVCMGEHAFVGAHDVPVCLSGGQRLMLDFFFISLSPLYTEARSLTYTKSPPVGLLQLASLLLHFFLYFPPTKITGRSSCPLDISMGAGDLSSSSHAGLASPLPAEPSPEPPLLFLTYEKHCI